jgi:hypothetical protein
MNLCNAIDAKDDAGLRAWSETVTPDYAPMTDAEADALLARVKDRVQEDAAPHRKGMRRSRVIALALAAALAIGTVSSYAADAMGLDAPLMNLLDPDTSTEKAALAAKSGVVIGESAAQGGITATAVEAVGDRDSVSILFEIRSDAIVKGGLYVFSRSDGSTGVNLDISGARASGGNWSFCNAEENGVVQFVYVAHTSYGLAGKHVTMTLDHFAHVTGEDDEGYETEMIAEGPWVLRFKLDYKDASQNLHVNRVIPVDGETLRLKNVYISPFSLSFRLNAPVIAELSEGVDRAFIDYGKEDDEEDGEEHGKWPGPDPIDWVLDNVPVSLTMDDGTVFNVSEDKAGCFIDVSGLRMNLHYDFGRILDPSKIASISIGEYTATFAAR